MVVFSFLIQQQLIPMQNRKHVLVVEYKSSFKVEAILISRLSQKPLLLSPKRTN